MICLVPSIAAGHLWMLRHIVDGLCAFLHTLAVSRHHRRAVVHWLLIVWIAFALYTEGAHQADVAFLLLSIACEV